MGRLREQKLFLGSLFTVPATVATVHLSHHGFSRLSMLD